MLSRVFNRRVARITHRVGAVCSLGLWTKGGIELALDQSQPADDWYTTLRLVGVGWAVGFCSGLLPSLVWPISLPMVYWYNTRQVKIEPCLDLSDEYPQQELK